MRKWRAELRAEAKEIRRLRATGKILDREEAEGRAEMWFFGVKILFAKRSLRVDNLSL